jgi:2-polyprenyl-3-methyl-5-hydroxy-6-metoxy-1,4-benzoquinol methylase
MTGLETLDRRDADPVAVRATLRDLTVINTLFGGRQAVAWGVGRLLDDVRPRGPVTLLDVGAGSGDITRHVAATATRWPIVPLALDHLRAAARACATRGVPAAVGDLFQPPVRARSVDVIVVSQVLHHLPRTDVPDFLGALSGMARLGVVVADLRRSRVARAGIWTAAHLLRFHPVTHVDAVMSVSKGFTQMELDQLCRRAGVVATVRHRPGWRLVAWWRT